MLLDLGSQQLWVQRVASKAVILDSSKDYTGINNLNITGDLTLESATNTKPHLKIKNTNADDASPQLQFIKDSSSPADGDELGRIYMFGDDDAGNAFEGVLIRGTANDVSNGSEDSSLEFLTYGTGSQISTLTLSSGNVGIGTAPDTQLHVKNTGGIELRLEADSNNNGQEDSFVRFYTDGKTQEGIVGMDNNNSSTLFSGNTENGMVFGTVSNLPTLFATNNTERMQIQAGGHVCINGTTNASADGLSKLTVGSGSGDSGISIYSGASNTSRFMFADGASGGAQYDGFIAYQHQEQLLGMGVAGSGSYSMVIASNKEVRVGTTNDYSSKLLAYHDVSDHHSIVAESNNASFTSEVLVASSTRNSANASYRLIQAQRRGYSVVFTVNDAGNAQNTNNSFTGISDERLKINIEDASSQWDDIKGVKS